jgi:hypothetical protein
MTKTAYKIRFKAKLCRPAESAKTHSWSFLVLPKNASAKLPSRGMTAIEGTLNGFPFRATLEPDGQKSHWLKVDRKPSEAAGAEAGDVVTLDIAQAAEEPEPAVPSDLRKALAAWLRPGFFTPVKPLTRELQPKNSTAPVSRLYIAPVILTVPLASSSASTGLSFRISATVISTFLRATASTKA